MKNGKVSVRRSPSNVVSVAAPSVISVSDAVTSSYEDIDTESSEETVGVVDIATEPAVKKRNIRRPPKVEERNSDTTSDSVRHPNQKSKAQSIKTPPSRPKSTSKKGQYPVDCPFCATSNIVHVAPSSFQIECVKCCSTDCGKEYWVRIEDGHTTVTKQYPLSTSTSIPADALRNMRGQRQRANGRREAAVSDKDGGSSSHRNHRKRKKADSEEVQTDTVSEHRESGSSSPLEVISPPRKKRRRGQAASSVNCKHQTVKVEEDDSADDDRKSVTEGASSAADTARAPSTSLGLDDAVKRNPERMYFDTDSESTFLIPRDAHYVKPPHLHSTVEEYTDGSSLHDHVVRPYECAMSHVEMARPCARTLCSDFIAGDSHCWEAVPMMLPGNVPMARIGYRFQCCWCSMEVCFVENDGRQWTSNEVQGDLGVITADTADAELQIDELSKVRGKRGPQKRVSCPETPETAVGNTWISAGTSMGDGDHSGGTAVSSNDIERQCRRLHASVLHKWRVSRGLPIPPVDVTSFSRVPASLDDLKIKDRIMASDGTNWLPGWIEKIDDGKKGKHRKVLVHFKGWNSRWDKWYNVNTGMLKTVNEYRRDKRMHSATRNEGLYEMMKQKYPHFTASSLFEAEINRTHKVRRRREKEEMDSDHDTADSHNDTRTLIDNGHEHGSRQHRESTSSSADSLSEEQRLWNEAVSEIEIVDADIVMMHKPAQDGFMEELRLPIHNHQNMVLSPPLFWSTSSLHQKAEHSICELVRDCFGETTRGLKDADIWMIYTLCELQIDRVFFTLHCLKRPERVAAYLKVLQTQNGSETAK